MREVILKSALILAIAVGLYIVVYILSLSEFIPSTTATLVFEIAIVPMDGFFFTRVLRGSIRRSGWRSPGTAIAVSNFVSVTGYIIMAFAALSVLGVSATISLARGAFAGIVIGSASSRSSAPSLRASPSSLVTISVPGRMSASWPATWARAARVVP